ncbi:hypothetical protein BH24ACT21_BH24ACT21_12360 [soil metagenome]
MAMFVRLGLVATSLSLAMMVAVSTATPLHSEPGDHISVKKASFAEPTVVERPVAVAKGSQSDPPRIRPEPAVPPELRNVKPEPAKAAPAPEPPPEPAPKPEKPPQPQPVAKRLAEKPSPEPETKPQPKPEPKPSQERRRAQTLPAGVAGREAAKSRTTTGKSPARPLPSERKMALSIEGIGLRNSPIQSTDSQQALDNGLIHLPQTSRPWKLGKSRNVYVVGHRMGWPGTESWKIFYRLDELERGDELVLTAGGKTYRYKVSERLVVSPWDVWVTDPVRGRDLLSLQTCTGPNFSKRLIVRADRV